MAYFRKLTLSERKEERAGYLFILPNLLGIILIIAFPIVFTLVLGFTKWNVMLGFKGMEFVGLDNFIRLFGNERFRAALSNNLMYTFTTVPCTIILALILAGILNQAVYAKGVIRAMFFMPYISSMVAVAVVWNVLLYPNGGPVNSVLQALGVRNLPGWFTDKDWAMPGLIILAVWYQMGYYMIILLAGMQNVPRSLYEAADIDGAGTIQKFIHVTVPGISPTIFFVLIIATINSFKVFDQINIITKGGPGYATTVLVYEIYRNAFYEYNFGMASAISWVLLLLVLALTVIQWIFQKKWVTY
ncbi:carbohydrate ABC transporter permease [Breznakiella homolactica]|uniref:Sugar ABC transporter permease n=1 Tax=Breznakiella homolactica TaxID=2798577 RepID=A0A7T8BAH7_9SPIR|nr:sugar ABC transporter permease [Breznakiella homolactica]QQO09381.1 sugar ABC transporter permease [Breznakiella homolactica]